jgi:protein-L-isoaspartate(D-aspartate) O-methyltransferase
MNYSLYMIRILPALIILVAINVHAQGDYETMRDNMVTEVEEMMFNSRNYVGSDKLDPRVIEALKRVPRHEFVPTSYRHYAYQNRPLPIGEDQTISQPYIVALMTDLAQLDKDSIVLEVGTGSGYQAAVLAELVAQVYTIEIIEVLGKRAETTLNRLGYDNITVRIGDGYNGWPEQAPFDAILVTAAPETVPQPLIDQLKPGGRLVIPVGPQARAQSLRVIEKDETGEVTERDVIPVGFVPLTREQ